MSPPTAPDCRAGQAAVRRRVSAGNQECAIQAVLWTDRTVARPTSRSEFSYKKPLNSQCGGFSYRRCITFDYRGLNMFTCSNPKREVGGQLLVKEDRK
jgi:hypothetical protein